MEDLKEKLVSDYNAVVEHGKQHFKKQCVEFAKHLNVRYRNYKCNSWGDLVNLWASKEGLDQHNKIWQVK